MYTERTDEQRKSLRTRMIACVVAACLIVLALFVVLGIGFENAREQGAASVRSTILDTAMQAAAIEGAFPSNLSYLEQNYGLRVNHDDYIVTYEVFASNVAPSVVVVPR